MAVIKTQTSLWSFSSPYSLHKTRYIFEGEKYTKKVPNFFVIFPRFLTKFSNIWEGKWKKRCVIQEPHGSFFPIALDRGKQVAFLSIKPNLITSTTKWMFALKSVSFDCKTENNWKLNSPKIYKKCFPKNIQKTAQNLICRIDFLLWQHSGRLPPFKWCNSA